MNITVENSLPTPWLGKDIGSVGVPGTNGFANSEFTLNASGNDIWHTSDSFHFVYHSLSGNGQIIAQLTNMEDTDVWSKAGVMMRASLNANSSHAMVALSPSTGVNFFHRISSGGNTIRIGGGVANSPYWIKLVRDGNLFSGYSSSNGSNWQFIGSHTISMPSNIYIGLVGCSHDNAVLNTSKFSNVVGSASVFTDEFNDGDLSNWNFNKGQWFESAGDLVGMTDKKTDIFPSSFGGCGNCTVEAELMMQQPEGVISLIGWYQNKKNYVELMLDDKKDRLIFKQRSESGSDKQKIAYTVDPNKNYKIKIVPGATFKIYINNSLVLDVPAVWAGPGIVGFRIKNTTGLFERVSVK